MYVNGEGVPVDDTVAVRLYGLAAAQGHANAQFSLGIMYANGEGVPENTVQAYAWLNLSITAGHENAKKSKAIIEKGMTP